MNELPLARRMDRVGPSAIMELLKVTGGGGYLNFASGLPDPTLFPAETLRELAVRVLEQDSPAALQYGPAEGWAPLREWVAGELRRRGLPATPEHVLITHGSQQALDLAARLFLNPGDRVLLEGPSYLAAIQIFDSHEASYEVVGMDEEGMDVDGVAASLDVRPAQLLFTLPNYQNPTGRTMSLPRREALAQQCAARDIPVLEDDAYHDLRYDGEPLPPVAALADNPLAVYTGTFSKTIAPGLRVGYLYAAPDLVRRLGQLKQLTDLQTGSLTQRVALAYCECGELRPQIARLCETYHRRRDAMLGALEAGLGGVARWTRPAGGMFLFLTLPPAMDAGDLLEAAMAERVAFVPGRSFFADGSRANTLRLNFVSVDETAIRQGIGILARLIRQRG